MERVCESVNISLNKNTVVINLHYLHQEYVEHHVWLHEICVEGYDKLTGQLLQCVKICQSRQLIFRKKLADFNKNIENGLEINNLKKNYWIYDGFNLIFIKPCFMDFLWVDHIWYIIYKYGWLKWHLNSLKSFVILCM